MKRCAYCGRENNDSASICNECGSPDLRMADDPVALAQSARTRREQSIGGWLREKTGILSPSEMDGDFASLTKCATLNERDIGVGELESTSMRAVMRDG